METAVVRGVILYMQYIIGNGDVIILFYRTLGSVEGGYLSYVSMNSLSSIAPLLRLVLIFVHVIHLMMIYAGIITNAGRIPMTVTYFRIEGLRP
jgi:hypothetical protein